MAKKRSSNKSLLASAPMMPMEPSPKQELEWAMDRAIEKAVLAHPRTQKLRDVIKQRMMKAAGNGDDGESTPPPSARKSSKKSKV